MQTYESDVCVVGGGISAALISQKLSELAPDATVTVVEAGDRFFDLRARSRNRRRWLDYRENAWPGDFIEDQEAEGMISRTMAVGGSALHWGAVCNRFSREDLELRSRYGLAVDWPLEWAEFERFTCEAERRLGVQGEEAPYPEDRPSAPYPMPPMPLSYNLQQLKRWAQESGIRFQGTPEAKNTVPYDGRSRCMRCNTCSVCPTGARYSPDFTFRRLLDENRLTLHDRTLIRKLIPDESGSRIVAARGLHRDRPDEEVEYRAPLFVIASGYVWSSHLLLLSANSRFPEGLANRSGLVGRYMTGHAFISAFMETDTELYPGMMSHSLVSREFFRCPSDNPFVRHDLRVWENEHGQGPRLRDDAGSVLLGDELLDDWRSRTERGMARVRAYYDVHPDRDSALTLDPARQNRYGDPLPSVEHRLDEPTQAREAATKEQILGIFGRLAGGGKLLDTQYSTYLDHPCGGCRMGTDPSESVCDSFGRTHDHENLFVVGAPTLPTGGCTNGTLTFSALTLRSAEEIGRDLGWRPAETEPGSSLSGAP